MHAPVFALPVLRAAEPAWGMAAGLSVALRRVAAHGIPSLIDFRPDSRRIAPCCRGSPAGVRRRVS